MLVRSSRLVASHRSCCGSGASSRQGRGHHLASKRRRRFPAMLTEGIPRRAAAQSEATDERFILQQTRPLPSSPFAPPPEMPSIPTPALQAKGKGITNYFENKIDAAEQLIHHKTQNLRRLEAQRNALNARVRLLREELQLLQEPGSYVGEVVKLMGKKKVLVKVQPEGKYGSSPFSFARPHDTTCSLVSRIHSRRLCRKHPTLSAHSQSPSCSPLRLLFVLPYPSPSSPAR